MPDPKYLPGTKNPNPKITPSEYTDAQWKALEGVKQKTPKLLFGAARPEFVNKAMLPDGSISTDLVAVRAACIKAVEDDAAALEAFLSANGNAVLRDKLAPAAKERLVQLRGMADHDNLAEFDDHVAQERFLIIVDADLVPRIWFQCATVDEHGELTNPDVELAVDAE